jgi:enamine deaminase RidA (YjgF/YER057c/UK114 family)
MCVSCSVNRRRYRLPGCRQIPLILNYRNMLNENNPESNASERFSRLGLILPPAPEPMGVYKPCLEDGKYLYLSGHGPVQHDKSLIKGRVGKDLDMEQAKLAARQVGLTLLATIVKHVGSLNRVRRVVKVLGMVNCTGDFEKHPYVINGCSELFAAVWGADNGVGVRSAVGVGSLPGNIPVEVEALFELY